MNTALRSVRFLHSGWCSQFARLAGEPSWKWIRFYAVFVYFEHPVHGGCLIDTGYSNHFFDATRWLPQRIYRWVTPVVLEESGDAVQQLRQGGIDPAGVKRVFISHFHADHVAGLKCLADAEFIYRKAPFDRLQTQAVQTQVRHGYLSDLIPDDFAARSRPIEEARFQSGTGDWQGFQVCDYWNDGSLLLVDLPGHADGHFGFVLQSVEERVFYIVDACWHVDVLLNQRSLPWLSRRFQHDAAAYFDTQQKLRRLSEQTRIRLLACHCPGTLEYESTTPH